MSDEAIVQAVTFGLGAECFAIPVTLVREILDYRETFHIPNGPAWLLGLTDVRGQGVPTIDLRTRLGLAQADVTPATRILVIDAPLDGRVLTLGLVVDRVLDVSAFTKGQMDGAPDIGINWPSEYILGVARRNDGFVVMIDVPHIFSDGSDATLLTGLPKAA